MIETPEEAAKRIFGERAAFYSTSAAHKDPQVPARIVALARPERHWKALDVATGSGHTAFAVAPYVHKVIAIDLTPEMLKEAERLRSELKLTNVEFRIGDVHKLPFHRAFFNLITCRRAAHHFSDIARALSEMKRVLRAGGRVIIDDRSVPEDDFIDRCMNRLDKWHDESHVRQYRPSEWRRMLEAAGFRVEIVEPYTKHRPLDSLIQGVSPENVARIREAIAGLTSAQRAAMNVAEVGGVLHTNHWYVLISAEA